MNEALYSPTPLRRPVNNGRYHLPERWWRGTAEEECAQWVRLSHHRACDEPARIAVDVLEDLPRQLNVGLEVYDALGSQVSRELFLLLAAGKAIRSTRSDCTLNGCDPVPFDRVRTPAMGLCELLTLELNHALAEVEKDSRQPQG